MNKKKLGAHFLGPSITAFLSFITLPILSNYFSIDDIGKFSMLQLAVNLSLVIFSIGLHQSFVREYYECGKKGSLTLSMVLVPISLFFITILFSKILNVSYSHYLFEIESDILDLFVSICLFSGLWIHLTNHILRMQERVNSYAVMLFLPKLLTLLSTLTLVFYFKRSDFQGLIYCALVSYFCSMLFCLFLNKGALMYALSEGFDRKITSNMIRFGSPLVLGGLAFWLLTAMDKVFIKQLSSYSELGYYSMAANFTAIIALFSTVFLNIWNPLVYKWVAEKTGLVKFTNSMDLVFIAILCLWSLSGVFSWIIPLVLPEELKKVETIFLLLIGGPILKLFF
ncbi:lipopolysaccharide biosynthesis protein [Vibrio ostreae]|uniref:Oligosaccharide flippase family protein n=1 Tax=Vibrio ostreae TaxID=2841925 RepID=A0A975U9X2_9VIBR|nr:oligosaccharide flippase family protein [Vibrio ostreae]QXO17241.1 oligosaccharide flippase family protein [Vibrio ostreae]